MKDVDQLLGIMSDLNPEAVYPSDMKEAIIGYVERFGTAPLVLLDRDKCIDILIKGGMTFEDAQEYFEYNTIGSWVGEGTPVFATLIN